MKISLTDTPNFRKAQLALCAERLDRNPFSRPMANYFWRNLVAIGNETLPIANVPQRTFCSILPLLPEANIRETAELLDEFDTQKPHLVVVENKDNYKGEGRENRVYQGMLGEHAILQKTMLDLTRYGRVFLPISISRQMRGLHRKIAGGILVRGDNQFEQLLSASFDERKLIYDYQFPSENFQTLFELAKKDAPGGFYNFMDDEILRSIARTIKKAARRGVGDDLHTNNVLLNPSTGEVGIIDVRRSYRSYYNDIWDAAHFAPDRLAKFIIEEAGLVK